MHSCVLPKPEMMEMLVFRQLVLKDCLVYRYVFKSKTVSREISHKPIQGRVVHENNAQASLHI